MAALLLAVDPASPDPAAVARAAEALRAGRLVVLPTETVYGLAARADDPAALRALREAKGRDGGKPFSLHLPSVRAFRERFPSLPEAAARLASRRLPGPLTLVVPDPAGGATGVRVPDDAVCRAVLEAAGCPVVATSVNPSGAPPAVTAGEAAAFASGFAAVILDAGPSRGGAASTVVAFEGDRVAVLREGAVPAEEVLEEAARLLLFVCTGNLCRSPLAAALAARTMAAAREVEPGALPLFGRAAGSAGTAAPEGRPASPEMAAVGRSLGVDLGGHRSRGLTFDLVDRADRLFTATAAQRESILAFVPGAERRILLLDPRGRDVPDPVGRGDRAYRDAGARIERAVRARAEEGTLEG